MRALVVEDNADICAVVCAILRRAGLTATAVNSSREAVALLARGDLNVLIVDLWLDGSQCGLDIARAATARGLRCVIMSGAADCRDQVEALGFRFLAKRFRSPTCSPQFASRLVENNARSYATRLGEDAE